MYIEENDIQGVKNAGGAANILTRTQKFVVSKVNSGEASPNIAKRIKDKVAVFTDMSLYISKVIVGGALNELFTTSPPDKSNGLTNVDKAVLSQDFAINGIEISYGFSATAGITDPRGIAFVNVAESTDLPAAILNGEFELFANGRSVTKSMPMRNFFAYGKSTGSVAVNNAGNRIFLLEALKYLKSGDRLEIQIRPADNVALLPANGSYFIRVDLHGMQID